MNFTNTQLKSANTQ